MVIALFCLGLFGITQLSMESGWKTYLDENSEKGAIYGNYVESFQSDSIILIIEAGDPLEPGIL